MREGAEHVGGVMGECGVWGKCMDTLSRHLVYFLGCVLKEEEGMLSSCSHQGKKGTWQRRGTRGEGEQEGGSGRKTVRSSRQDPRMLVSCPAGLQDPSEDMEKG